jgi:DNA-directed RNA polymerase subunit omega
MVDITNEKALIKIGNSFILATLVSERVKELLQGEKPLVQTDSKNPAEIAFQEIHAGKITHKLAEPENE